MNLRHPNWGRVAGTLAVLALLAILFRGLDPHALARALRSAEWRWIALASLLNLFFNTWGRVMRFSLLLSRIDPERERPPFTELIGLLLATRSLNILLPARAGESFRALKLNRRYGYRLEDSLSVVFFETLSESLAMALPAFLLVAASFVVPGLLPESGVTRPLHWFSGIGLVILLFAWMIARADLSSESASKVRNALLRFGKAIRKLNLASTWARALSCTWFADAIDLVTIGLSLKSIGVTLDPISWFLVFVGVNLAIALPAMPGHLGSLEAGAVLVLVALGVDRYSAAAFALIYHAVQLLPILLAGLVALQLQTGGGLPGLSSQKNRLK